jgi:branched-chain amino acid transport system ATP-binding protein
MTVFEGRKIQKRYGGFTALAGVDIAIRTGEIRGLIGPNGAGKSTLIDCLSGRTTHQSEGVFLDGHNIAGLSVQQRRLRGLARSFQRINVFPDITVAQQLNVAARAAGRTGLDEIIDDLDLRDHLDDIASQLSYGHQRRLDLALALVGRPKVLLLDEPSAGLTVEESRILARILRSLVNRWDVSVLIVEHDMDVIFAICDEITVLHLGKVLAEGAPASIRANPQVVTAYLGSAA